MITGESLGGLPLHLEELALGRGDVPGGSRGSRGGFVAVPPPVRIFVPPLPLIAVAGFPALGLALGAGGAQRLGGGEGVGTAVLLAASVLLIFPAGFGPGLLRGGGLIVPRRLRLGVPGSALLPLFVPVGLRGGPLRPAVVRVVGLGVAGPGFRGGHARLLPPLGRGRGVVVLLLALVVQVVLLLVRHGDLFKWPNLPLCGCERRGRAPRCKGTRFTRRARVFGDTSIWRRRSASIEEDVAPLARTIGTLHKASLSLHCQVVESSRTGERPADSSTGSRPRRRVQRIVTSLGKPRAEQHQPWRHPSRRRFPMITCSSCS